ncbi:MAG TPA: ATP-binding cassette domain-containing protein [Candidatus Dormibacteraeota bacterium]
MTGATPPLTDAVRAPRGALAQLRALRVQALRWGGDHGLGSAWVRWALAVAALAALPLLSTDDQVLTYADLFLIYAIAVMGLNLQHGLAGVINLGAGAFLGMGAYAAATVSHHLHWPMPLPVLAAMVVAPLFAVVIGGPALLLSRVHFAMISLYAALLVPVVVEQSSRLTGGIDGLTDLEPLEIAGYRPVGAGLYGVLAAFVLIAYVVSARIARGPWGRAFVAVKEDSVSAAAVGISVQAAKLRAVTLGAVYGVLAGALLVHAWPGNCPSGYAGATCVIAPGYFAFDLSVLLVAAVVIGGPGARLGPLVAAALLVILRWYFDTQNAPAGDWQTVIYGALLIVWTVALPQGLAGVGQLFALPAQRAPERPRGPVVLPPRARPGFAIAAQSVRVAFVGAVVLDGVDFAVEPGQVHAIVGPNGSGKTTLLNCITGMVRPAQGQVVIDGRPCAAVAAHRAHRRARMGLGRTFQTPRVQPQLTVLQNVMQGLFEEARRLRGRSEAGLRQRALGMLTAVGLESVAELPAARLAHGERRLLEVARALVGEPGAVLLDEPAAGLDAGELARLRELLGACRAWGVATVLVEHDLDLVQQVADQVTVLDQGRVVARGTPEAVRSDPAVARAFMGPKR